MEVLAAEARKLIYTIICFQCLLQLTEGSTYQKYLKLFSYLLTLCICCTIVVNYVGQVEESLQEADKLYADWERDWLKMMSVDNAQIEEEYQEQKLWEDKIIEEAYREYDEQRLWEDENIDSQKGEIEDVGEDLSTAEGDGQQWE